VEDGSISGTNGTPLPLRVSNSVLPPAQQVPDHPLPKVSPGIQDHPDSALAPGDAHSGTALERGGSAANADPLRANRRVITTITENLVANTSGNRAIAQRLVQETEAKLAELRDARRNDDESARLIEFLEWLARELTRLLENLDRAIADPLEPIFLGRAAEIARTLKVGLLEAVEKHRVRIWEVGAVMGAGWFLTSLSGEKLSDILKILLK
jgi:hypothetical protein